MPSPIPFRDFRRWFERWGVIIEPSKAGSSHYKLIRHVQGQKHLYIVPVENGRRVKSIYLDKARKALKLRASDGIADEAFFD